MQKSEFIAKIKTLAKKVYAEKANPMTPPEDIEISPFPVLDQFPPLKSIMDDLFDFQYEPFVKDIEWVSPRPTTFRVMLVNGADFYLVYEGKDDDKGLFIAQVSGKKYWLESLPEEQQASDAIARLLRYNYANTGKSANTENEELEDALGGGIGGTEELSVDDTINDDGVPATVDDL